MNFSQMFKTVILIFILQNLKEIYAECLARNYGNKNIVCVCNINYCDTISKVQKLEPPNYVIYTSNEAGLRFSKESGTFEVTDKHYESEILIKYEKYQEIFGWGGAFTDSACINIKSLNENLQQKILESYFSEDGLEYNLCRVPIGGTDFSTHAYSYHDTEDINLTNFNLSTEDFEYKIPLIKKAMNLSTNLNLVASAWTAPKWMKINNQYAGMFGFLKTSMYQSWANYFLKFLDKYKDEGIDFWGITTGNEPSLAFVPSKINSVTWFSWNMRTWIENNLGPTLRNSQHSAIKIMALDDQRFFLPWYINDVFSSKSVQNTIDGIAVHWYQDKIFPPSLLTKTHDNYPDKFILATEACTGDKLRERGVYLGSWQRGEDYANSIIEDINHWVVGWLDWNIVLDLTGGPTYIQNNVDSPIIVNATGGEFYKQPMYYAIGHFSKFVPRGSYRIYSSQVDENVPITAFQRPDNGIVVEILNKYNKNVTTTLLDNNRGNIILKLSPKSLTTILYW